MLDWDTYCPKCGKEITSQTIDQMVDKLMGLEERTRIQILAPIIWGKRDSCQSVRKYKKRGLCQSNHRWRDV